MEQIGNQDIFSFLDRASKAESHTCTEIRASSPCKVDSFLELATKVAELQFRNRNHVLMFRGQSRDHKNVQGRTSLKPSLFRPTKGKNPSTDALCHRFSILSRAEILLVREYRKAKFLGSRRLERYRILRWAILQHYEICSTPLLDVTHSLRIAASFASARSSERAYIFVLGVPNLSGAVTASAEAGIQIVRLASVCPPSAMRPHIQEGYLLGEYPEMIGIEQKASYKHFELDFGRRLVAKFQFNPRTFWKKNDDFPLVAEMALYPSAENDPVRHMAEQIKLALNKKQH